MPQPTLTPAQIAAISENTQPLDGLLECQWRGIGIPVVNFTTNLSHDIAVHKYPYVDGAKLEEMGRNPLVITATAIFFNTIRPAKQETWKYGELYPTVYTKFMEACFDGSTGTLQHPFYGTFDCKVNSAVASLQADVRGGETVQVTWTENNALSDTIIDNLNALDRAGAKEKSRSLDAELATVDVGKLFPYLQKPQPISFNQLMNNVLGIVDTGSLLSLQAINLLNKVIYYCNLIIETVHRINSSTLAAINQLAFNLKNLCTIAIGNNGRNQRPTKTFLVTAPTTLQNLVDPLQNSLSDLINLNPRLIASPVIPAQTPVLYYIK